MSARRFKFVSPGIFINEIDNSQLPRERADVGPVIVGRLNKGPGLRPVQVSSFSEFVDVFGEPTPGGTGDDVWRNGNTVAPTYAAYAAQAYLRNASPITVVRTLGVAHEEATSNGAAGWKMGAHADDTTPADNGGVYGLFLFSSGSGQRFFQHAKFGGTPTKVSAGEVRMPAAHGTLTGSLAAVWYFDQGGIALSGTLLPNVTINADILHNAASPVGRGETAGNGIALRMRKGSNDYEFSALLYDQVSANPKKVTFNFNRNSDRYIRKVFNTNPTLLGTAATLKKTSGYWLGETFDRSVKDLHADTTLGQGSGTPDASVFGVIAALASDSDTLDWGNNEKDNQPSRSGWFISQDLTTDVASFKADTQQKLFRFESLHDGDWSAKNLKISISDHRAPTEVSPYGSFSVLVRRVTDSDASPVVLERFSNCDLNPSSKNFIARKIGDQYQEWDSQENRYRVYNQYTNQSSFIRVIMDEDVDAGLTDPAFLPWGFWGPPRYKSLRLNAYSGKVGDNVAARNSSTYSGSLSTLTPNALSARAVVFRVLSGNNVVEANIPSALQIHQDDYSDVPFRVNSMFASATSGSSDKMAALGVLVHTGSSATDVGVITFPSLPLRISSSDEGLQNQKKAFFGVSTYRTPGSTRFENSYIDLVAGMKGLSANVYDAPATGLEPQFIFTLDDLCDGSETNSAATTPTSLGSMFYHSGSRQQSSSYTAKRGSYTDLIKAGFTGFTSPLYGGFDGLNVKEREPFGDHILGAAGVSFKASAEAHSVKRAIDSVQDPEAVEMNVLTAPGIRAPIITNHMINVCEERADAIAIIDPEKGGYAPTTETSDSFKDRVSNNSVSLAVDAIRNRNLNTSYACAYFPWVKVIDEINDKQLWVPPSVVALGAFASTQARSELWFAPAGFTRGGLTEGSAGIPVLGVSQRLSSKDRDDLYEVNINPIAQFPAEGIVIFGQKTLQSTPSALDRINVRRLMVFLKKEISIIASTLIFDNNVQSTWNRFRGQVEPFLEGVKARLGLTDFRVILDETTTTPELVDRNIMYAKILLKPARAIEFIAIDFVITNSGASFDD